MNDFGQAVNLQLLTDGSMKHRNATYRKENGKWKNKREKKLNKCGNALRH